MDISCKLSPNKRNYLTAKKEALAVKQVMESLWYYLWDSPFWMLTNYAPPAVLTKAVRDRADTISDERK